MQTVHLPMIGTDIAWRDAARAHLAQGTPPEALLWTHGDAPQTDLFGATAAPNPAMVTPLTVPKPFVDLSRRVVWHSDPERFARLYAFLWRLRDRPALMRDTADPDLIRLNGMEKNVRRCAHKMKAFVRFRDIAQGTTGRRRFAAWFEPTHFTLEPTSPFFARRFADMDWVIATPHVTARHENGRVTFAPGQAKPDLPEDGAEQLWETYFCNIFNPARVKISAMQSEMPRKYWKNMPEAKHIPALIAGAEARVREMAETAPTLPPLRAARVLDRLHQPRDLPELSFDAMRARAEEASRDLPEGYGRIILGEGPQTAQVMIVGEQPGDHEDQAGRPFVGPAGQLFDRIAAEAGLDRTGAYVTNAVKQFKFRRQGKRRIHMPPNRTEIEHGRWWLDLELQLVHPKMILSMGATALQALTGSRDGLLKRRGQIEATPYGPVLVTVHPSYLLRLPDRVRQEDETALYRNDLAVFAGMAAAA
ncbi:UdgX family uracil-DNA binding protein [Pseudooceanicola onchidii]|uniref:UdgX family uracil-DNA binding protein n=1 Tax=Pseudooceanicola onchidii TaxID=2562279 RepID=UPI0010AB4173|nr:UdgX family uracil-DNA binding protein [Pseudooceanicola onchidii]